MNRIQEALEQTNINIEELAKKTKLSLGQIDSYLRKVRNPSLDTLYKIADAIGCKRANLIDEEYSFKKPEIANRPLATEIAKLIKEKGDMNADSIAEAMGRSKNSINVYFLELVRQGVLCVVHKKNPKTKRQNKYYRFINVA